jgi:hypothetical protein
MTWHLLVTVFTTCPSFKRAGAICVRKSIASLFGHLDPLREKLILIPFVAVLSYFGAILYYISGAQLFLQPQLLSHRGHSPKLLRNQENRGVTQSLT